MSIFFSVSASQRLNNLWLLFFRIAVSSAMLTHGYPKLLRFFERDFQGFPDPLGIGSYYSLLLAMMAEVLASVFIMFGFATRISAIALAFTMAVAVFVVHANDPFRQMEMGLLYLLAYLSLIIFGPGKYSLDNLTIKKK